MIPKKPNSLYQNLAEESGEDVKLIESFVEFYYKELRHNMTNLKHIRLNVEGLGHFYVKSNKVKKTISNYSKWLAANKENTFSDYHNKKRIEHKLTLLTSIYEKLTTELENKRSFKTKKNESLKGNLEKPETDC